MNLKNCYIEEDLFPKIFTKFEERDYGILFYNTENKDSFDSNHAVIYRERIQNLQGRSRGDGIWITISQKKKLLLKLPYIP